MNSIDFCGQSLKRATPQREQGGVPRIHHLDEASHSEVSFPSGTRSGVGSLALLGSGSWKGQSKHAIQVSLFQQVQRLMKERQSVLAVSRDGQDPKPTSLYGVENYRKIS